MLFAIALGLSMLVSSADASSKPGLSPKDALEDLKSGNARFVSGKLKNCETPEELRKELASGQAPDAVVLSCSDSRVAPELIFDQGLGDLFTIRVAGNVLTPETLASIEYAVAELGSRLIVVLGHESCGAIKAALKFDDGKDAGSKSLNALVAEIQRNLSKSGSVSGASSKKLRTPVLRNISAVAAELSRRSPLLKSAIDSGRVKVVKGIYSLDTVKVEFWE